MNRKQRRASEDKATRRFRNKYRRMNLRDRGSISLWNDTEAILGKLYLRWKEQQDKTKGMSLAYVVCELIHAIRCLIAGDFLNYMRTIDDGRKSGMAYVSYVREGQLHHVPTDEGEPNERNSNTDSVQPGSVAGEPQGSDEGISESGTDDHEREPVPVVVEPVSDDDRADGLAGTES